MAKYAARPFDFAGAHCLPMIRSHLVAMGHKGLPRLPHYSNERQALRALRARGHDSLGALLDSLPALVSIAPAMMLPGDIAWMRADPAQDRLGALVLCVGHKVWGWHAGDPTRPHPITPHAAPVGAWRA